MSDQGDLSKGRVDVLREQELETVVLALQESENALKLRVRQRGIVADLGQRALSGADLNALMEEAAQLVAQTLEVEYCNIMEMLPDSKGLLLKAGYGWKKESIGLIVETENQSISGYTVLAKEPVVIDDLNTDSRFETPQYLQEYSILSGISIVIHGHEKIFGSVGAYTTKRRAFTRDEINFLQTVANVLATAIQRKQSEEAFYLLARIVQSSDDAIISMTTEGTIISWNPGAEWIYGYQAEEVRGQSISILFPLDCNHELAQILERIKQGEGVDHYETVHVKKGMLPIDVSLTLSPIEDKAGNVVGVSAISRNITERKRAQEKLKRSEIQLAVAQEIAHVGSWERNLETDTAVWSTELYRIFGLNPEEPVESFENFLDRIHPDDRELVRKSIEKAKVSGRSFMIEFRLIRPSGEIRTVQSQAKMVMNETGEAIKILGAAQDITERKEAEERLRKSEILLSTAQQIAHIGSWEWDLLQGVVNWSDEMYRIHGLKTQDFVPTFDAFVQKVYPEDRLFVRKAIETALSDHRPFSFEYRLTRPDGKVRTVYAQGEVVLKEGQPVTMIATAQDITERKRFEEQLRTSREQLRALSAHLQSVREEERVNIAREVHDELGQVLTALKMDLSLLNYKLLESSAVIPRRMLFDEIKSMTTLVDATIQSVRKIVTELRPEVLDHLGLKASIEWQAQEFQTRTGLLCNLESNLESFDVEDRDCATAVFRILQETLTNVVRHSNATRVDVLLKEEGDSLILQVKDNGRGITENEVSNAKSFGILGIRERALLLGGEVEIRGDAGIGTIVTVEIPLSALRKTR
jgi:PAS domain S-box-containing protein